jgi:hypothetical protein
MRAATQAVQDAECDGDFPEVISQSHALSGCTSPDASIVPQAPGSNTNEPSLVIGEKCAAAILEDAMAV